MGTGRLAYAGISKGAAFAIARRGVTMENAAAAVMFRNGLKRAFRLGLRWNYRMRTFESALTEYGTAERIIFKAGSTNPGFNNVGAMVSAGGVVTLETNDKCECKR